MAAVWLAKPKCRWISRVEGMTPFSRWCCRRKSSNWRCRSVSEISVLENMAVPENSYSFESLCKWIFEDLCRFVKVGLGKGCVF